MSQGLVIGGTGMLAGTVRGLLHGGWDILVPSRRPWTTPDGNHGGTARWLRAEWSRPVELARVVEEWRARPIELVVAWVHTPHREPVLRAVAPLLAGRAPVVEVWASATADPLATLPPPVLDTHPTHQVVLGYHHGAGGGRWLTNTEISEGVLAAALAAASGEPGQVHEVGILRPWPPP